MKIHPQLAFVGARWDTHCWNPKNNCIGLDESELYRANQFFQTARQRNALVLPYQMKFVRKAMERCLRHDHLCYNISNEGWAGLEWEIFSSEPYLNTDAGGETCLLRGKSGAWAIYFPFLQSTTLPAGGQIDSPRRIRWFSIDKAKEADSQTLAANKEGALAICPPGEGSWLGVVDGQE